MAWVNQAGCSALNFSSPKEWWARLKSSAGAGRQEQPEMNCQRQETGRHPHLPGHTADDTADFPFFFPKIKAEPASGRGSRNY